jgi:hypothetical protein
VVVGSVAACGGASTTGDASHQAIAEDDWQTTALWLHATAGSGSSHEAECSHVAQVLEDEQRCQGRLCRYGLELASQWFDKCTKLAPPKVAPTKKLQAQYREAIKAGTTACAKELESLLGDGCKPVSCAVDAQRWATRCGETEAGPLAVGMVQRNVQRYGGEDASQLDMRSCDSLRDELRKGASCDDQEVCRDLWSQVKLYRKSCEAEGQPPDMVTGIYQMAIAYGAERSDEVIKVSDEPELIFAGQFPLTLADGKGVILGACWKRPQDRSSYQKIRDECQSGTLDVVRVRSSEGGGRELRFGKVALPTVLPLTTLYPWLRMVGDQVQEDDRDLAALRKDLAATVGASPAEGARKLLALANGHARFLRRSIDAREALGKQDAALAPLFEQLATIKVNGGLRVPSLPNRWSLLQRAKTRPFADLGEDATLQLGAFTAAHSLTLAKTLPKATAAYRRRLGPLVVMVERGLKPSASDLRVAKTFGRRQVAACDTALDQMVEVEGELLSCPFDPKSCGAEQQHGLGERWREARDAVDKAHHGLNIALGVLSGIDDSLATEAANAGCVPP